MSGLCIQCTPNTVHFNISSFVTNTSNHQNQYFDPVKFPVKVKTNTGNWATLGLFLSRSFYPVEPRSVPANGISISPIAIIEGWRKLEIYLLKKPICLFCVVPKKIKQKLVHHKQHLYAFIILISLSVSRKLWQYSLFLWGLFTMDHGIVRFATMCPIIWSGFSNTWWININGQQPQDLPQMPSQGQAAGRNMNEAGSYCLNK